MNRHFSKENVHAVNKLEKTHHHWSLEKCKSKTTMRYHLTPVEWQLLKSQETRDAGEDVEKQECFYIVGGNVNQFNHCGRQGGDSSGIQKQKYHLSQQSYDWVYTQRIITCSIIKTHAHVCLFQHYSQQQTWNQPKCSSVIDWIKKMWYICTMEYYIAIKNEFTSFAGTWMKLEAMTLRKLTQEQKIKHFMFSRITGS